MNLSACSYRIFADLLASKKREWMESISSFVILSFPSVKARIWAGLMSCTEYLREVDAPTVAKWANACSSISMLSVEHLIAKIVTISLTEYGRVLMIKSLSRRSTGIPWGDYISVPLIVHRPLFVANTTIGARFDSRALFKYVKHSISNMWTSSMNRTPGTNSAIPWSIYLFTTLLISCLNLSVISVFFDLLI